MSLNVTNKLIRALLCLTTIVNFSCIKNTKGEQSTSMIVNYQENTTKDTFLIRTYSREYQKYYDTTNVERKERNGNILYIYSFKTLQSRKTIIEKDSLGNYYYFKHKIKFLDSQKLKYKDSLIEIKNLKLKKLRQIYILMMI